MKKEQLERANQIEQEIRMLKWDVKRIGNIGAEHSQIMIGDADDKDGIHALPNLLPVDKDIIINGYLKNIAKKIESLEKELARL